MKIIFCTDKNNGVKSKYSNWITKQIDLHESIANDDFISVLFKMDAQPNNK